MKKLLIVFLLFTALMIGTTASTFALTKSGDLVVIPQDQTIDETLFVSGQSITIQGTVNGDIMCTGQNILIEGTVNGDVLCAGQTIRIAGPVDGNIRVAGQTLDLNSSVTRNVTFFGQSFTQNPESTMSGELLLGVQTASINGTVGKKITGGGQSIILNGSTRSVEIAGEDITIGQTASIAGNLVYSSKEDAKIASGASIRGEVTKQKPKVDTDNTKDIVQKGATAFYVIGKVLSFIALLVVSLLIALLFPRFTNSVIDTMNTKTLNSFLWGLVILIGGPILMILFLITIIGIPIAFFGLLLYILAIIVARAFVAIMIGELIMKQVRKTKQTQLVLSALVGVIITWLLFQIPLIGWLASFLAVLWGLGAFFIASKEKLQSR